MHIKSGDTVQVISGENKGDRGQVHRVLRGRSSGRNAGVDHNKDRVVVAGVNLIIKHQRRTGNIRTQTGRIEREAPIHISNVMLICPRCNEPTRVGIRTLEDNSKARYCKNCDSLID